MFTRLIILANVITFSLENVVFDDGTTATGTFTFDTTTLITTPHITTVDGTIFGATYTTPITAALDTDATTFDFINSSTVSALRLVVEGDPSSESYPSLIFRGDEAGLATRPCGSPTCPGMRNIKLSDNPTVDPTPLPATVPLFATGIGRLGLLGWRRRRNAQADA
jgi:hypothetical protein